MKWSVSTSGLSLSLWSTVTRSGHFIGFMQALADSLRQVQSAPYKLKFSFDASYD
jgi:hypothetical protein